MISVTVRDPPLDPLRRALPSQAPASIATTIHPVSCSGGSGSRLWPFLRAGATLMLGHVAVALIGVASLRVLTELAPREVTFPPKTKNNVALSIAHKVWAEEDCRRI